MSNLQNLFRTILPEKLFQEMQAESKLWMMKCPHCNHEHSLWDLGGLRYKAAGNPRRYIACPNCGMRSWQSLFKGDKSSD